MVQFRKSRRTRRRGGKANQEKDSGAAAAAAAAAEERRESIIGKAIDELMPRITDLKGNRQGVVGYTDSPQETQAKDNARELVEKILDGKGSDIPEGNPLKKDAIDAVEHATVAHDRTSLAQRQSAFGLSRAIIKGGRRRKTKRSGRRKRKSRKKSRRKRRRTRR